LLNFSINLETAKAGFFDRKSVIDEVSKRERKALSKFGAFVRRRAKSSIRTSKKYSRPGQPPKSHSGLLRNNILFSYDRYEMIVVIGPTLIGSASRRGRYGVRTVPRDTVPHVLEYGGYVDNYARKSSWTRKYEARPYMTPAYEEESKDLQKFWD